MSRQCQRCGKRAYSDYCVAHKPRKPLRTTKGSIVPLGRRIGKQAAADRETKLQWIQNNITEEGVWYCYLNIAPNCLRVLTIETLTIDHVIPKGRGLKYRHDPNNLKPACFWCNSLKGSRTIEALSTEFPHLKNSIDIV